MRAGQFRFYLFIVVYLSYISLQFPEFVVSAKPLEVVHTRHRNDIPRFLELLRPFLYPTLDMSNENNSKQRLIPWLRARIESGSISGLGWLDAEKSLFRIPWKHGGKQNFDSAEDSRIFREWAIHTGKYSEASDKADPTKWKQNLRCAFNKSKEIEEVKERHCLEGTDPFKVYKIKNKMKAQKRLIGSPPSVKSEADSTSTLPVRDISTNIVATIDRAPFSKQLCTTNVEIIPVFDQLMVPSGSKSVTETYSDPMELERMVTSGDLLNDGLRPEDISIGSLPSLSDVPTGTNNNNREGVAEAYIDQVLIELPCNVNDVQQGSQEVHIDYTNITILPPVSPGKQANQGPPSPSQGGNRVLPAISQTPPTNVFNRYPEMHLRVRYLGEVMFKQTLGHPAGCRVRSSKAPRIPNPGFTLQLNLGEEEELFGNSAAHTIELPPFSLPPGRTFGENNKDAAKYKLNGQNILDAIYRGVELNTMEGDVYIKRLCKCNVFCESSENLDKVDRFKADTAESTLGKKIFDYRKFETKLEKFKGEMGTAEGVRPNPFVHLVFGQKKKSGDAIVCVSVASKRAFDQLLLVDPSAKEEDYIMETDSTLFLSKTDEFDQQAELVNTVEVWTQEQAMAVETGHFENPEFGVRTNEEEDMDL